MSNPEQEKPVYVTFAPLPSGENLSLPGFFWEFTKLFGHIAQKFNPLISVLSFFVAALVAHYYGLGLWSLGVGLAVAIAAWFVGGALIFWSAFSVVALAVFAVIAYLLYLFISHIAS